MRNVRHVRLPQANKQTFYYARLVSEATEYQKDDDGNIKYVRVNGKDRPIEKVIPAHYSDPVKFEASINVGGGRSSVVEFGIDNSEYSATLTTPKGLVDITETCLIWHETEPAYKQSGEIQIVDENSADYHVVKVQSSLLYDRYILAKRVKNGQTQST